MKTLLLIRFGDWCVWRSYDSRAEAEDGLVYWGAKCSWPLKIAADD